ncbi:MAG: ABC transporter permease DevC [Elusimicrobia bacterium]|nr:ABC transporter permease DevC [Elusimicrobiota bacterium]MDE2236847.1 ABC transporter permease DevC [Elusimicrobiota bacterium]MDE2425952.1 ABC transporter permease DevC [Elusimicrobiota bacterium]
MRTGRVFLSWLQLSREKRRLAAAIAGIAFAVVLMLVQLGFKQTLIQSASLLYSHLTCDLVMISPEYEYVLATGTFDQHRLYQALGFPGVESVSFLNAALVSWKNPSTLEDRVILLLGFKPRAGVFDLPDIDRGALALRDPEAVLFDSGSRSEFGPVAEEFRAGRPPTTEIEGRRVRVAGLFRIGTSFGVDGTVLTGDLNFARLAPGWKTGRISLGLIDLRPGVDAGKVRDALAARLARGARVLTREQFMALERSYWVENTPVGFIFNLGVLMGLIVGCIIVYQILYTDVSDHLREYATLKAMGYPDRYFFFLVLQEALILSLLGFLPGALVSQCVYGVAASATLLPLRMTPGRLLAVYALTALMCAASGVLATRRLRLADPAEIF